MSTAILELPNPCISRPCLESRLLRVESNVTVVVTCLLSWFKILVVRLDAICKYKTLLFVNQVKVANIADKQILVVEHAFPLTGFVGMSAHANLAQCERPII